MFDAFVPGKPRVWPEAELINTGAMAEYDLAPDGKRVAALPGSENTDTKPVTHAVFLVNFFDEGRRQVGAGRPVGALSARRRPCSEARGSGRGVHHPLRG